MTVSLIIIALLFVVGLASYIHYRVTDNNDDTDNAPPSPSVDAEGEECCGMHITCERDSLAALTTEIEYYDDEELDTYAGRGADDYADSEVEQFRDVLLTLLPSDIAGWARSLQLRGVALPTPVRDELLMIVAEARTLQTQR